MNKTLKPYLINAFYSWCMDTGKTPMIVAYSCYKNKIPNHLSDEEYILLNIHPHAVRNLVFSKNTISLDAQFNSIENVVLNYDCISTIYSKEEEEGLEFPLNPDDFKPKITLITNNNNT